MWCGRVGCGAFLMDKQGQWSLAPAFDVTYSYNPSGAWTATHQMTLNGKRDAFDLDDIRGAAKSATMKRGRAEAILEQVRSAVARWPEFAAMARVPDEVRDKIQHVHRLDIA
jgi:serine/threonine-protein kinase HipA